MRRAMVATIISILLLGQIVFVFATQKEPTVHMPVLPSKVTPISFGIDVLPFDESMDEVYIDPHQNRYRCVVDENFEITGPFSQYASEYLDMTGKSSNYFYPGTDSLFVDYSQEKGSGITCFNWVKGNGISWVSGTDIISYRFEEDGVHYTELYDISSMKLVCKLKVEDDDGFYLADIVNDSIALYRKNIQGERRYPQEYRYKYIDFRDGNVLIEEDSTNFYLAYRIDILVLRDRIFNLSTGESFVLPENISEVLDDSENFSKFRHKDGLLFIDRLTYNDGTVHNCLLSTEGVLIKDVVAEESDRINRLLDFTENYILYYSHIIDERINEPTGHNFRVLEFDSNSGLLCIDDNLESPILKYSVNYLIGNFLFLRDRSKLDIYNIKKGTRIKRIPANGETTISKWNDDIYAVDNSHILNRSNMRTTVAFKLNEDLSFDYSEFIPWDYLEMKSRTEIWHPRIYSNENEESYTITVKIRNRQNIMTSFEIPKEDYFYLGYYYYKDDKFYSFHENGKIRVLSGATGDVSIYTYPKINLEKYKVSYWGANYYRSSRDEVQPMVISDELFSVYIQAIEKESSNNAYILISGNFETQDIHTRVINYIPSYSKPSKLGVTCYNKDSRTGTIYRYDGETLEFDGIPLSSFENYLYYKQNSSSKDYREKMMSINRINIDDLEIEENILHKNHFPELPAHMFEFERDDHHSNQPNIESSFDTLQAYVFSDCVQKVYQDRLIYYRWGDCDESSEYLFERTPCATYSIREVSRDNETISFEIVSTRDDGFSPALEGKVCLLGWGHEIRKYPKKEIIPKNPVLSKLDSNIVQIGPLKPGESQIIKLWIPARKSVILKTDFKFIRDGQKLEEELVFYNLVVESNGLLDAEKSKIIKPNPYSWGRFDGHHYNSLDKQSITTNSYWHINAEEVP